MKSIAISTIVFLGLFIGSAQASNDSIKKDLAKCNDIKALYFENGVNYAGDYELLTFNESVALARESVLKTISNPKNTYTMSRTGDHCELRVFYTLEVK